MIALMAYAVLITACLTMAALASESVCRALRIPTRWGWIAAMGLALAATVAVMLWPLPDPVPPIAATASEAPSTLEVREVSVSAIPAAFWQRAGLAASVAWAGASAVLLVLLGVGAAALMRERRMAGRSVVHGHDVLLTDGVGPAVAGLSRPVALIPRWVLEMDEASQRLLLAHEMEHVRARDSAVLVSGAMIAALLPWNPLVWWMLRRLRLAVEVDCDRRVLAREASVRRYAELLLMTARMPSEHARLLVAGLGESESDLERRIVVMTERSPRRWLRRAVVPGALAAGLIVVACETPRPDPVSPSASDVGGQATTTQAAAEQWIAHREPARLQRLPVMVLSEPETEAEPHYHFNSGDSIGYVELRKLSELRVPLAAKRLQPGKVQVKPRALTQEPRIILRDSTRAAAPIHVVIVASDGRQLAVERNASPKVGLLSRVNPEEVASIEVTKGALCRADGCPRITVTLKPGATLSSR